uniref:Uncharacterized protein n=3 Tax=Candidatus Kentrum sp. FM TaxID=2126340 RepID=A0A450TA72_9GAMM|nr:MAG: hypothetical protein BECKFM1743C_GA0114222_100681 [Candidatus Kentron sp. FM]VFJ63582.1 MAG: hypothetical protein BECKFM1743A_GA0114220_103361 [Candidatus Kentron sp. FM]VFK17006.1 MAG: hypothetical protein BECKFM1743B_GA0114221_104541 [Candidatus Kentron sp. FM]
MPRGKSKSHCLSDRSDSAYTSNGLLALPAETVWITRCYRRFFRYKFKILPLQSIPGWVSNNLFRLLLDSGLMADLWDYPSEIDVDGRMFGGEHLGSPLRSPRT